MSLDIVQIGANRGNDDLTRIISMLPSPNLVSRLVLVEPLEVHHTSLFNCYEIFQPEILTAAVSADSSSEITIFYHLDDGPLYEVASLSKAHIQKHAQFNPALADDSRLMAAKVPCFTLGDLLTKLHIRHPDVLFMDCEGADGDIVKSLLLGPHRPLNLYFENCHLPDDSVYEELSAAGYLYTPQTLSNGWMTHAFLSF